MRRLETLWQDTIRHTDLFVPQGLVAPSPMVLMLHGAGGNSEKAAQQTAWCELAMTEGFIVAFPNGLPVDINRPASFLRNPQVWNSGVERGLAYVPKVDDVGYIRQLLDEVSASLPVDCQKIFAAGFSNGGGMCWRLGLELAARFAAVAPVCSYVSVPEPWLPGTPVSLIAINCLEDPFIPIDGGPVKDIWSRVEIMRPSVIQAIENYATMLGCESIYTEQIGADVKKQSYRPVSGAAVPLVDFYTIARAGHVYPGGPALLSERIAGKPTDALDATAIIWQFFKAVSSKTSSSV